VVWHELLVAYQRPRSAVGVPRSEPNP
jgi:hypothetical protein